MLKPRINLLHPIVARELSVCFAQDAQELTGHAKSFGVAWYRTPRAARKAARKLMPRIERDMFELHIPTDHAIALESAAYARHIGDKKAAHSALRDAMYIRRGA